MSKHTPGPWHADGKEIMCNAGVVPPLYQRTVIAEANIAHCLPAKANARLIAAAPELLEALQTVLSMCDSVGDFSNGVTDPTGSIDEGNVVAARVLREAHAVVAKATGEQQ